MAIDSQFNYEDKLSLDKAKLIGRSRINDLGSYELIIQYNKITSVMREEALEWLEANRLQFTDPKFSFKTYEGVWNCVDITYNEDSAIIRQRFKIDVGVGDLGDSTSEPDFSLQTGDLSRISEGMQIEKSYYWKVTNPLDYELPTSSRIGEILSKSAVDNGDGTYDVTITREIAQSLSGSSSVQAGDSPLSDYPGGYTEDVTVDTNSTELDFVSNGGVVPDAIVGQIKRIENSPLENGLFRTTITTRTAIPQRIPPESENPGPNYPWLEYGSDYLIDANNLIIGRNQPWSQVIIDRDRTNIAPAIEKINSMSVRVNDYGLYDYTITSNSPG